jgi:hypothetical protein
MKHLIICLDGTWSDGNAPASTNIAVLAGIMILTAGALSSALATTPASAPRLIDRIAGHVRQG